MCALSTAALHSNLESDILSSPDLAVYTSSIPLGEQTRLGPLWIQHAGSDTDAGDRRKCLGPHRGEGRSLFRKEGFKPGAEKENMT